MAAFTFADFLIFAGVSNANEDTYTTVAKGVLKYIKEQYGIYPEDETIVLRTFLESGQRSFIPKAYPIQNVYTLAYDGDLLNDGDYSYHGEDILLTTALLETRKPLVVSLDVGFGDAGVPDDLILAIYRHMEAAYYAITKHTDNVDKVINATGNTTYFAKDVIPAASIETYRFYAGHTLLSN